VFELLVNIAAVIGAVIEIPTAAAARFAKSRQPRAKTDDKPFAQVERVEQDLPDTLNRAANRSGNADLLHGSHGMPAARGWKE
jgi:hypothetical protein